MPLSSHTAIILFHIVLIYNFHKIIVPKGVGQFCDISIDSIHSDINYSAHLLRQNGLVFEQKNLTRKNNNDNKKGGEGGGEEAS